VEVSACRTQIIEKFELLTGRLVNKKLFAVLFDKNEMTKRLKQLDKSASTLKIENYISGYYQTKET
jgi:hypothetical protein